MAIALVTVAYRLPGRIASIRTARSESHRLSFQLFVHSFDPQVMAECEDLAEAPNVHVYPYGVNRGLARSWNEGLINAFAQGTEVAIICNDDVAFDDGDIDALAAEALSHPECALVWCAGLDHGATTPVENLGFSCIAVNPIAIETIGCLDENFFPAYCEDQDYACRVRLAGLPERICADTHIRHVRGATLAANPELDRQNKVTHARNLQYYRRKWGGDHGAERFQHPFDDPDFGYRIDPEERHAPYGPRNDRTDHDIVRI